jgi:hypothetical protein
MLTAVLLASLALPVTEDVTPGPDQLKVPAGDPAPMATPPEDLKVDTAPTYIVAVGEAVGVYVTYSGDGSVKIDPVGPGLKVEEVFTLVVGFLDDGTVCHEVLVHVMGTEPGAYDVTAWFVNKDGSPRRLATHFHVAVRRHNDPSTVPIFRGAPDPAIVTGSP